MENSSKRLDTIFVSNRDSKFAMLIVESDDSYLGKKVGDFFRCLKVTMNKILNDILYVLKS